MREGGREGDGNRDRKTDRDKDKDRDRDRDRKDKDRDRDRHKDNGAEREDLIELGANLLEVRGDFVCVHLEI